MSRARGTIGPVGPLDAGVVGSEPPRLYDSAGRALGGTGLPPSLPKHIGQVLEREIIEGSLAPGQRVTEDELARRVGVSRTPVREAMRMLEGQGLILHRRDKGAFVAERTDAEQAAAIYEVRVALESHLAAQAATTISESELDAARRLHREFQRLVQGGKPEVRQIVSLDSDLHWTIYNATGSDLVSIVGSYWGRLQRELYDPVYRGDPRLFAVQHEQLLDALQRQDAEAARATMSAHIRAGWDAIARSYAMARTDAEHDPSTGAP
jgi:DNA-binding GntR family transcriptional regulator